MSDYYLRILVQLVKANADTSSLLRQGLTYAQISKLIMTALYEGLLVENNQTGLSLTDKGLAFIGLNNQTRKTNKNAWISSDEISRIEKIDKEMVFLPDDGHAYF